MFRRRDIARVRNTYGDGAVIEFDVAQVDLYFFLDVDVAVVAFEMHADNLPLDRVQDTLFRFGRAYPRFWDAGGHAATACASSNGWTPPATRSRPPTTTRRASTCDTSASTVRPPRRHWSIC